jgi:hypothetical protein
MEDASRRQQYSRGARRSRTIVHTMTTVGMAKPTVVKRHSTVGLVTHALYAPPRYRPAGWYACFNMAKARLLSPRRSRYSE